MSSRLACLLKLSGRTIYRYFRRALLYPKNRRPSAPFFGSPGGSLACLLKLYGRTIYRYFNC